jgi:hypothetical protein
MNDPSPIVTLARRRLASLGFWSLVVWWCYVVLKIVAYAAGIVVPFGLAATIYAPQSEATRINLYLLAISFVAITIQVVLDSMKFRDRALRSRFVHRQLELALTSHESGDSDGKALLKAIEDSNHSFLTQDIP